MAAGDLVMQGAKASAARVLTQMRTFWLINICAIASIRLVFTESSIFNAQCDPGITDEFAKKIRLTLDIPPRRDGGVFLWFQSLIYARPSS